jgi:C-terminal processing protease CtpA/Prc
MGVPVFAANGWTISLTVGQIASPEGAFYKAIGIPPDMFVPLFTDADFAAGSDPAIDAALVLLSSGG